jgi:glycopeptide antibiotics resistance protein
VSLVGNINEFLEFVYRYPVIDRSGGVFYLDTSFDIFTNALGAFMAWVIFVMIFPNYHREAVEESLPKS